MGVGGRGRNLAEGTWQPELSRCGRRDGRMCLEAPAPEEVHPCPPSALPGHRRNGPANMRPSTTIRADHSPWVRGPQASGHQHCLFKILTQSFEMREMRTPTQGLRCPRGGENQFSTSCPVWLSQAGPGLRERCVTEARWLMARGSGGRLHQKRPPGPSCPGKPCLPSSGRAGAIRPVGGGPAPGRGLTTRPSLR